MLCCSTAFRRVLGGGCDEEGSCGRHVQVLWICVRIVVEWELWEERMEWGGSGGSGRLDPFCISSCFYSAIPPLPSPALYIINILTHVAEMGSRVACCWKGVGDVEHWPSSPPQHSSAWMITNCAITLLIRLYQRVKALWGPVGGVGTIQKPKIKYPILNKKCEDVKNRFSAEFAFCSNRGCN